MKLKVKLSIKGETILETVIAFAILSSAIVFIGLIIGNSFKNTHQAKDRIIAINVAREGIEAMRNIRDTNWLKFSGKKRQCWNHMPGKTMLEPCNGQQPILPGEYIIYKQDGTTQWRLFSIDDVQFPVYAKAPQSAGPGTYYRNSSDQQLYVYQSGQWELVSRLSLVDIDPLVDSDSNGVLSDDADIYNHLYPKNDQALGNFAKKTNLSRRIIVEYIDNKGSLISDVNTWNNSSPNDLNRMRITSIVTWKNGGNNFDVELSTHLTDYLNRKQLAG